MNIKKINENIKSKMIEMYQNGVAVLKIQRKIKEIYNFDISFYTIQKRMEKWEIIRDSAIN